MRQMTLAERKDVVYDILCEIDRVCITYGIKYYIGYGSLLGAVRHNDFIPWDDDIDLWVPQNNFLQLIDLLRLKTGLCVNDHIRDVDWPNPFSKVYDPRTIVLDRDPKHDNMKRGVAVDLFMLVDAPDSSKWPKQIEINTKMILWMYKYRLSSFVKSEKIKNLFIKTVCFVSIRLGMDELYWKNKLFTLESNIVGNKIGCADSPYKNRDIYRKECFADTKKLLFRDRMFCAPVGYDEILTSLYGDYMKLPPVEKRVSNHESDAYWIE